MTKTHKELDHTMSPSIEDRKDPSRAPFWAETLDRAIKTGIQFVLFYIGIKSVDDFTNIFEMASGGLDPQTTAEYFASGFLLSITSSAMSGFASKWRHHYLLAPTSTATGR